MISAFHLACLWKILPVRDVTDQFFYNVSCHCILLDTDARHGFNADLFTAEDTVPDHPCSMGLQFSEARIRLLQLYGVMRLLPFSTCARHPPMRSRSSVATCQQRHRDKETRSARVSMIMHFENNVYGSVLSGAIQA